MIRAAVAAIALLLALPAAAQWSCYPGQVALLEGAPPVPTPGRGTALRFAEDAAARAYGWWCPQHYTPASFVLVSGPLSAWPADWKQIGLALLRQPLADRVAARAQYATVTYPVVDGKLMVPADVFPAHNAVWTAMLPDRPADPVWKVAPNPPYATRPAYAYSGGIRATVATARANVDATCYCDARDVATGVTYCAVNTARTWMSVCTKR